MAKQRNQTPKTVSEKLRMAVEESGMTQYAVAKAAGVNPETVYRFMRRERDIQVSSLDKLCLALKLHLTKGE